MGKIRVIVAKVGLDGHDRGAKVVARALRDAGVEVIYTGLHQTPEQIVAAAIQEDVDAVGLSILSGAHMTLFSRVIELLKERDAADIVVFGGGIIPDEDIEALSRMGVARIFTPGAPTTEIVAWVREKRQVGSRAPRRTSALKQPAVFPISAPFDHVPAMHIERHEWDIHAIRPARRAYATSHISARGSHEVHGPQPVAVSLAHGTTPGGPEFYYIDRLNGLSGDRRPAAPPQWPNGPWYQLI